MHRYILLFPCPFVYSLYVIKQLETKKYLSRDNIPKTEAIPRGIKKEKFEDKKKKHKMSIVCAYL